MQESLANKQIILGITGSIAAYKSVEIVRRLTEAHVDVQVVMTKNAKEFITPLTLQAVSGKRVRDDLLDSAAEAAMGHIELARWADLILIAPASANFIARLAQGAADDLLTTLCLATTAPIVLAPAMNQQMWLDEITQQNVATLRQKKMHILGPAAGSQACGEFGPGRLLEPSELLTAIAQLFPSDLLSGKKVLISAGPTREMIDPMRFISNRSSGKMGYALAHAAVMFGAQVTLVSGPVALPVPDRVRRISVISALEMQAAVLQEIAGQDIFISAAAVSDYRCKQTFSEKQVSNQEQLQLALIKNPDIVASVTALRNAPFTVGFAAQTHDVIAKAREKLQRKKLQMIIANQVSATQGFERDENAAIVLWDKQQRDFPLMSKERLARELMQLIAEQYIEAK